MTYRTKQELETIVKMQKRTIAKLDKQCNDFKQEIFALRKKAIVNPLYNRPIDLKERVDREAEVEIAISSVYGIRTMGTNEHIHQLALGGGCILCGAYIQKQPFSIIKWIKQWLP